MATAIDPTVTLLLSSSRQRRRDKQSSSESLPSPGGRGTRGGGLCEDRTNLWYFLESELVQEERLSKDPFSIDFPPVQIVQLSSGRLRRM